MNKETSAPYQPWHPITDPVDLKHLGKLGEECGELGQAVCRCIIQGMYETNLKEGKSNESVLEDEIADVLANIQLVIARFDLDESAIHKRKVHKIPKLQAWHRMA